MLEKQVHTLLVMYLGLSLKVHAFLFPERQKQEIEAPAQGHREALSQRNLQLAADMCSGSGYRHSSPESNYQSCIQIYIHA